MWGAEVLRRGADGPARPRLLEGGRPQGLLWHRPQDPGHEVDAGQGLWFCFPHEMEGKPRGTGAIAQVGAVGAGLTWSRWVRYRAMLSSRTRLGLLLAAFRAAMYRLHWLTRARISSRTVRVSTLSQRASCTAVFLS